MQVHHRRLTLPCIQIPDTPMGIGVWEEPQIPTPSDRAIDASQAHRRKREFDEASATLCGDDMTKPWGIRDAVEIVPDGEDARVIHKTFFPEDIQSPETLRCDRITRRTVTDDGLPGCVFQHALRAPRLRTKLFRCLCVNTLVCIPMRRHFVTTCGKHTNQSGMPLCDPAQHKKSGF